MALFALVAAMVMQFPSLAMLPRLVAIALFLVAMVYPRHIYQQQVMESSVAILRYLQASILLSFVAAVIPYKDLMAIISNRLTTVHLH